MKHRWRRASNESRSSLWRWEIERESFGFDGEMRKIGWEREVRERKRSEAALSMKLEA